MRRLLRVLGWLVLLVCALSVVARLLLLELAEVGHDDMAPTLRQGERLVVYTRATLERGDVVVCQHPTEPGRPIVGRLMGLPGDVLEMSRGQLSINGVPVGTTPGEPAETTVGSGDGARALRVVRETLSSGRTYLTAVDPAARLALRPVTVGTGYYLLSDERTRGSDSRRFGEVDPSRCLGRALWVLLPADRSDGTSRGVLSPIE